MLGILGPSGRPMVQIGGALCWKTFTRGDLVISFQWMWLEEDGDYGSFMTLRRANAMHMNTGVYMLHQNFMFLVAQKNGDPTPALVAKSVEIAKHIGFFPDSKTCYRIATAIVELLEELKNMPDAPPALLKEKEFQKSTAGIEVAVKVNGQVIHEAVQ